MRKNRKICAWMICFAMLATASMSGCSQTNTTTTESENNVTDVATSMDSTTDNGEDSTGNKTTLTAQELSDITINVDDDDTTDTYDSFDAEIALQQDATTVSGDNASNVTVDGNVIYITQGGTYSLQGTLTEGQLVISAEDKVKLYFNGVNITCSGGPALLSNCEKRTIISLAANSENTLSDGAGYEAGENSGKAALYCKDNLVINGTGALEINGNCSNGVICKDKIKLMNGNIVVNAVNNGIRGNDGILLDGANVTIDATNDGIKATNEEDTTKGFVYIANGDLTVTSGGDCVQAVTAVYVGGGTCNLTSDGSSTDAETGESNSSKGIRCDGAVVLADGAVTLNTAEDSINSDSFIMDGGALTLSSGLDGIQTNGDMTINDGTIQVTTTGEVASSTGDGGMPAMGGGGFDPTQVDGTMPSVEDMPEDMTMPADGTMPDMGDFDPSEMDGQTPPDGIGGGDMGDGQTPPDGTGGGDMGDGQTLPDGTGGGDMGDGQTPPTKPDGTGMADGSDMAQPNGGNEATTETTTEAAAGDSTTDTTTDTAEDDDNEISSKGIKCGGNLSITGGTLTFTTTDHAIHSAGTTDISGGTISITSENKGISSHGNLTISNGDITVEQATEGIESKADMEISGGNVRILGASDDGLNTGGMSDSHAMTISGGYVYVCADGDGVDSNSTLDITGGVLLVCGPTTGADGSIDFETTMTYTDGVLLALSSKGMMEYADSGLLVATNCSASAGDQISIADADGNILVTLTSPKDVSDVIYGIGDGSSDDYTILCGGTYDGELNEDGYGTGGTVTGATEVTANGGEGSFSMGGGGMGGGNHGGGNMGGGMQSNGDMKQDTGTQA